MTLLQTYQPPIEHNGKHTTLVELNQLARMSTKNIKIIYHSGTLDPITAKNYMNCDQMISTGCNLIPSRSEHCFHQLGN